MTWDDRWIDRCIGVGLLILPFVIFLVMFCYWPSSAETELAKVTNEVTTLSQKLRADSTDQGKALAEQKRTDGDTATRAARDKAVDDTQKAVDKTRADLTDATQRLTKAAEQAATTNAPRLPDEARLCLLVVLAGALGASLSAARGFGVHLGDKDYDVAWRWWYILRIPTGCGIAFILYAVLRAGLVPWQINEPSKALDNVNPYGFVAIGALGGMFANETFQKLQEVLAAILSSGANAKAPKPVIKSVKLTAAGVYTSITITGQNFAAGASVSVNGAAWTVAPNGVTATQIIATDANGVQPGAVKVDVTIPGTPPQTLTWNGNL